MSFMRDIYLGFSFATYLDRYIKKKGLKLISVAEALEINYATFRSKLKRDSFSYQEIHFLDSFYSDLRYWENRDNYIQIRLRQNGKTIESIRN